MRLPYSLDKISFVGDWHRNLRYGITCLDILSEQGIQVIIHLGDFLHYGPRAELDMYLDTLNSACESNTQIILFIDGNHEDFPYLKSFPKNADGVVEIRDNIIYLPRAFKWEWEGVSFMAMGGAPSINKPSLIPDVTWFEDELITKEQYALAESQGHVDVLLTHDCPKGVIIPNLDNEGLPKSWQRELLHCDTQRQRLYNLCEAVRPNYLFHGHYHRDYSSILRYPDIEDENDHTEIFGKDSDGNPFQNNYKIVGLDELRMRIVL